MLDNSSHNSAKPPHGAATARYPGYGWRRRGRVCESRNFKVPRRRTNLEGLLYEHSHQHDAANQQRDYCTYTIRLPLDLAEAARRFEPQSVLVRRPVCRTARRDGLADDGAAIVEGSVSASRRLEPAVRSSTFRASVFDLAAPGISPRSRPAERRY
jgi:hypothetical protein